MHHHDGNKTRFHLLAMTIETDIVQPVKDFVRDSKFFMNRCTKPNKKGEEMGSGLIDRVHADSDCDGCWICSDGSGWLLRETDPYSY